MSDNGFKTDKDDEFDIKLKEISANLDKLSNDVKEQSFDFVKHEQQDLKIIHDVSFIKRNVEDIRVEIRDLSHVIRGNGEPGIVTRLAVLEALKKSKVSTWTQLATLIAAFLALFGTIVAAFITKF